MPLPPQKLPQIMGQKLSHRILAFTTRQARYLTIHITTWIERYRGRLLQQCLSCPVSKNPGYEAPADFGAILLVAG